MIFYTYTQFIKTINKTTKKANETKRGTQV